MEQRRAETAEERSRRLAARRTADAERKARENKAVPLTEEDIRGAGNTLSTRSKDAEKLLISCILFLKQK